MFRTRLLMSFVALVLLAILQGAVVYFALAAANQNVQKGRVANELLVGYMDLLSNKQLLRTLLTNELTGLESDPQQTQVHYFNMVRSLDTLDRLAITAEALNQQHPERLPELEERKQSLVILRKGVQQLGVAMSAADWRARSDSTQAIRERLDQIFDVSEGQDLRVALTQSIARERLITARDRTAADASLAFMTTVVVSATIGLSALLILLAYYFLKSLNEPLNRLIKGAQALQAGNLAHRIAASGNDEFSQVARSMNDMAREIARFRTNDQLAREQLEIQVRERTADLQEALHRLEKIELRRRQMFADISHELKTPTTAIRGEAEITIRHLGHSPVDCRETLQRIVQYTQQLSHIVDDMLTLARSDIDALVLDRKQVDVSELCRQSVASFQPQIMERHCHVETHLRSDSMVLGDAQRLKQVFNIILDNAIQYAGKHAMIRISTASAEDDEHMRRCLITIADNGPGIPPEECKRVFERHFRGNLAKVVRPDGSGLGLALAAAIVRAHHGHMVLDSEEGHGTRVTVNLPGFDATIEDAACGF
ncbi:MAG TPA: HAMP domain-containing sensor histidine kinase [Limnobacter sp.]|nr:HAMP domain-containing sensor histidine kinase [Limnobacter sp.]